MVRITLLNRRCVALIVCLVALGTLIPGVGFAQTTLQVALPGTPGPDAEMEKIISEFTKEYPEIGVQLTRIPWEEYFDKILVSYAAGAMPDIVGWNPQNAVSFYSKGVVRPLDSLMERTGFEKDAFLPGTWAYATWKGNTYGVPWAGAPFGTQGFMVRLDPYDEAGMPRPTADWTNQEFVEAAKRLTRDTSGDGDPDVRFVQLNVGWYYNWIWSNGGELLNADETDIGFTSPEAIEAIQLMGDLTNVHEVVGTGGMSAFSSGRLVSFNQGLSPALNNGPTDVEWTYLPQPAGKGGSQNRAGSLPMGISALSEHAEEAWTYLNWLMRADIQEKQLFEWHTQSLPQMREHALSEQYAIRDEPPYDLTDVILADVQALPMAASWTEVGRLLMGAVRSVIAGEAPAEIAIEAIAKQSRDFLK